MKRTKRTMVSADAILTSDLHLTDSTPVSRTDNYQEAQQRKLLFLQKLSAENNNCPILCAGDIFDHWKASPWLCRMVYYSLPQPFICIPGQHDLPGHSLQEYDRSALGLLEGVMKDLQVLKGGVLELENLCIVGIPFGQLKDFNPTNLQFPPNKRKVLMLHTLVWPGKSPTWVLNSESQTGSHILAKYKEYFDLILTGDNHQGFILESGNSILVNPGSMLRINTDQEDHEPKCCLYYADMNIVKPMNYPIEKGVHNREHLDIKKERDERISAYIERMSSDWEIGLSFPKNLEAFFAENHTPRKVVEIIWQHMEK